MPERARVHEGRRQPNLCVSPEIQVNSGMSSLISQRVTTRVFSAVGADELLERQTAIGAETLQRWLLGLQPLAAQGGATGSSGSRRRALGHDAWLDAPFDVEGYVTAQCDEGYMGPLCGVCAPGAERRVVYRSVVYFSFHQLC